MKKGLLFVVTIGMLAALSGCGSIDGGTASKPEQGNTMDPNAVMGGTPSYHAEVTPDNIKLDGERLTEDEIMSVFDESKAADIYSLFEECSRTSTFYYDGHNPCVTVMDEGGFYISTVPLQGYDSVMDSFNNTELFAFSKDKTYAFNIRIAPDDKGGYRLLAPDVTIGIYYLDMFKDNPDKKYAVIYNPIMGFIDEDNNVYNDSKSGGRQYSWTLSGDVFDAVSDYAVSYNEVSSPDKLVWIDVKQ